VAVALADGSVTPRSFTGERISDPKLHELMQKVRVHRSAALTAQYPEAMPNEVRVELRSGKVLEARASHARGHPKNPLGDSEIEEKFRTLTSGLLPGARVREILDRIWKLEEVLELGSLLSLLRVEGDVGNRN